jgi:hypothetical protein
MGVVNKNLVSKNQAIQKILEGMHGKNVILNFGGNFSGLVRVNDFSSWTEGITERVIVLNDGNTEQSYYLKTKSIKDWYIDAFNINDNVNINMYGGDWLQIYED